MVDDDVIRILLADDHPVFRAGLRATLGDEDDILVVGVNDQVLCAGG